MSLYPKCSRKNRKCLKPGSKCGEGIETLLSLSPNSLISKGLVNSHFGQPWNIIFSLVGNLSPLAVEEQLMVFAFPLATLSWEEMGMFHRTFPCLLLLPEGIKKGVWGAADTYSPLQHPGCSAVVTLGLGFHPHPALKPLSA